MARQSSKPSMSKGKGKGKAKSGRAAGKRGGMSSRSSMPEEQEGL